MKVGIVRFPGSNCDADVHRAVTEGLGDEATFLWHKSHDLEGVDVVVLPGGFSYGDYLRGGAIARFSPIMREVIDFARSGGLTLGICNGFQVLCEARILPGALVRNRDRRFRCLPVGLRVENAGTAFTSEYFRGQKLDIPIAHGQGQYVADEATLDALEAENRIVFRYVDDAGHATDAANPNGSARNIAGIINEAGNVLGLMPHPERHSLEVLGQTDGLGVFTSLAQAVAAGRSGPGRTGPSATGPAGPSPFDSSAPPVGVEA
ncbi:MAG: phosphoribosylformylglycinamidine synthase subunit PurQ [Gemmatimonadota bacterium]